MTLLHEMTLHETILLTNLEKESKSFGRIVRVPGGWLYQLWDSFNKIYSGTVFVPYHEEFK